MRRINIAVLFVASLTFLLLAAANSWAFRCGSGLVSEGDSKTQVQVTCGKPTSKEKSCENRREYTTVDKSGRVKKHTKCGKKVEVWHYNCGDNDFIYKLTFENDKLTDEDSEGHGKGKSDCRGK
jgi:hypothetical protein